MTQDVRCDLVLLSWNHLEETTPCLETLFQHTDVPSRLFIVDNGSEPDVRAFLRGVQPQGMIQEVVLLQHERNEGFPRGMNRGIRASSAAYVCLLNNDLRFTPGWLSKLIDVAAAHPEIGVLNPASSTFGEHPPQGMSLEAYARSRQSRHGLYVEVGMCIGFCMLITRVVIDRIGGLSEDVERIFFEDEDYCMRAQQAGFQCVVASEPYVYHAEHKTVTTMPEREVLFAKNRRWCEEKWGRRLRVAYPVFHPVREGSDELHQMLERMIEWARQRTYVYAYYPRSSRVSEEVLFQSVGLVPHADINWRPIPAVCVRWAAIMAILARRKKPFDLIVAPESRWAASANRLRWLHHADVIPEADEHTLTVQWKQKSRSPLSS